MLFSYLVMAFCGLLLVLQPVPQTLKRKLYGWLSLNAACKGAERALQAVAQSAVMAVNVGQILVHFRVLAVDQRHFADHLDQLGVAGLAQLIDGR